MSDQQEEKRRALENCLPMIDLIVRGIDTYRERTRMLDDYVNDDELTDAYAQLEWVRGVVFWHLTGIYPWSDLGSESAHLTNNPT